MTTGARPRIEDLQKDLKFQQRLNKEFRCRMCYRTLSEPVTMRPCGHSFCKACVNSWHGNAPENRERDRGWNKEFSRSLRAVKATKPCPGLRCKADLSDFLRSPLKVNTKMAETIATLKEKADATAAAMELALAESVGSGGDAAIATGGDDSDGEELPNARGAAAAAAGKEKKTARKGAAGGGADDKKATDDVAAPAAKKQKKQGAAPKPAAAARGKRGNTKKEEGKKGGRGGKK